MASLLTSQKRRILLVDDDRDILYVFRRGLERKFQVDAYSDPAQALARYKEHPDEYDLVLTDVRMPSMNGFELAKAIHDIKRVPVLFMITDTVLRSEYQNIFPAAESSFIDKPLSLSELEELVSKYVSVMQQ